MAASRRFNVPYEGRVLGEHMGSEGRAEGGKVTGDIGINKILIGMSGNVRFVKRCCVEDGINTFTTCLHKLTINNTSNM